jgi:F1F0 ATPase subunit 2
MTELWFLAPPLAAGLLLGVFFFGGLWWTVSRGASARRPALWFLGSLLVRMGVTLAGFYLAARDSWQRWLLCLLGFVLARILVQWLTRTGERSHAPQSR